MARVAAQKERVGLSDGDLILREIATARCPDTYRGVAFIIGDDIHPEARTRPAGGGHVAVHLPRPPLGGRHRWVGKPHVAPRHAVRCSSRQDLRALLNRDVVGLQRDVAALRVEGHA